MATETQQPLLLAPAVVEVEPLAYADADLDGDSDSDDGMSSSGAASTTTTPQLVQLGTKRRIESDDGQGSDDGSPAKRARKRRTPEEKLRDEEEKKARQQQREAERREREEKKRLELEDKRRREEERRKRHEETERLKEEKRARARERDEQRALERQRKEEEKKQRAEELELKRKEREEREREKEDERKARLEAAEAKRKEREETERLKAEKREREALLLQKRESFWRQLSPTKATCKPSTKIVGEAGRWYHEYEVPDHTTIAKYPVPPSHLSIEQLDQRYHVGAATETPFAISDAKAAFRELVLRGKKALRLTQQAYQRVNPALVHVPRFSRLDGFHHKEHLYFELYKHRPAAVSAKNPFGREADIGYSDESEEEEPSDGESVSDCSHSEDEESDESDGFIVPDDYLSEDEGADGEEVDMLISSGTKAKKERPQTVEPLVVISIGPVFDLNDKDIAQSKFALLAPFRIQRVPEWQPEKQDGRIRPKKELPKDAMLSLIQIVQHATQGLSKLCQSFQEKHPGFSKRLVNHTIEAISVKEKRPPITRKLWYVNPEILAQYGVPDTPPPAPPESPVKKAPAQRKAPPRTPTKEEPPATPERQSIVGFFVRNASTTASSNKTPFDMVVVPEDEFDLPPPHNVAFSNLEHTVVELE